MLTDFQNSFTDRLSIKFATNLYLNIPPHLKHVATLPCEMSMLLLLFLSALALMGDVKSLLRVKCFLCLPRCVFWRPNQPGVTPGKSVYISQNHQ